MNSVQVRVICDGEQCDGWAVIGNGPMDIVTINFRPYHLELIVKTLLKRKIESALALAKDHECMDEPIRIEL